MEGNTLLLVDNNGDYYLKRIVISLNGETSFEKTRTTLESHWMTYGKRSQLSPDDINLFEARLIANIPVEYVLTKSKRVVKYLCQINKIDKVQIIDILQRNYRITDV